MLLLSLLLILLLFWESTYGFSLEFEWHQVFRTLLSILANLNKAVVWMISSHPLIFKSSSFFSNLLVTLPRAPVIISITVTLIYHNLFISPARSYSFFSLSFDFTQWYARKAKSINRQVLSLSLSLSLSSLSLSLTHTHTHTLFFSFFFVD